MRYFTILGLLAAFSFMIAGGADFADAKRFGMGSSFGKQRMFSPKGNHFSQRRATPPKSSNTRQRGSARTGMMGMIGGLALGGLLGAMFFGGSFEGINLFDIVMIGGIIMLIMMFLRRRPAQPHPAYPNAAPFPGQHSDPYDSEQPTQQPMGSALRPEIDYDQFLSAAKEIYIRMQKAWDQHDIEDIRQFCTPEIADRIAKDMKAGETHSTEVTTLQAEIADSWIESNLEWVAVSYHAMLREREMDQNGTAIDEQAAEVNEVWIFQHQPNSDDPTWYLAGIQQLN